MSMPKPETETSPFPLAVSKPIHRFLTLAICETGLPPIAQKSFCSNGLYLVADALLGQGDRQSDTQLEFGRRLVDLNLNFGDLPTHPSLVKKLDYDDISPQLASAIKARLHKLTNYNNDYRDLGRPTFLALALLPDLPEELMTSELWDEFQDLLALHWLRPKMKFEEIFSHHQPFALAPGEAYDLAVHRSGHPPMPTAAQLAAERARDLETSNLYESTIRGCAPSTPPPPLNEVQKGLLTTSIYDLGTMGFRPLSHETVLWVGRLNYKMPSMIHALCSLLAVRPEERPEELVNWFTKHAIPIEPLSYEDLKLIGEEARG